MKIRGVIDYIICGFAGRENKLNQEKTPQSNHGYGKKNTYQVENSKPGNLVL